MKEWCFRKVFIEHGIYSTWLSWAFSETVCSLYASYWISVEFSGSLSSRSSGHRHLQLSGKDPLCSNSPGSIGPGCRVQSDTWPWLWRRSGDSSNHTSWTLRHLGTGMHLHLGLRKIIFKIIKNTKLFISAIYGRPIMRYTYMIILICYFLTGFISKSLTEEAGQNNNDYSEFHFESNSVVFNCWYAIISFLARYLY